MSNLNGFPISRERTHSWEPNYKDKLLTSHLQTTDTHQLTATIPCSRNRLFTAKQTAAVVLEDIKEDPQNGHLTFDEENWLPYCDNAYPGLRVIRHQSLYTALKPHCTYFMQINLFWTPSYVWPISRCTPQLKKPLIHLLDHRSARRLLVMRTRYVCAWAHNPGLPSMVQQIEVIHSKCSLAGNATEWSPQEQIIFKDGC